jgi:hypothetical protein
MGQQVLITQIVDNLARWLEVEPRINFVGLQSGEKLHEELFDGKVTGTTFSDIVKVSEVNRPKIADKIREFTPNTHAEITKFLKSVMI